MFFYTTLFIGISEVVMGGENVLQTISTSKYDTYPGIEDNEEEEELAESLDIHTGKINKHSSPCSESKIVLIIFYLVS